MKNQGFWITRIISFFLCVFVAAFMGYHIVADLSDPIRTVTAVLTATSDTLPVSGVVVRDEDVLPLPPGLIEFTVAEGEKVSAGQTIAVAYPSEAARSDSFSLNEKARRRELLAYISSHSGIVTDTAALDGDLRARTASLLSDVSSGNLSGLAKQSADIKALLFRQAYFFEGAAMLTPLIAELDNEISALSVGGSASAALRADKPGLFSPLTDGLEDVWTPQAMRDLTVFGFTELFTRRSLPPDENKGRLVRNWTWRYVCLMPAYRAKTLGDSVTFRFSGGLSCRMSPNYVSPEEDGQCAVVFSSDRGIGSVISERRMQGELVYTDYEGVRVPLDGLRIDPETGEYYVYCLILGRAVRKNIVLYDTIERDNYYLAEYYPETRGALLPGDEIIVAGKNLFAGKVIQ